MSAHVEDWDAAKLGPLTKTKRRRLEKAAAQVDRDLEADRLFFERRPTRAFRLRRAFRSEIEQGEIVQGWRHPPSGFRRFALVRQVAPGARIRLHIVARGDIETDVGDVHLEALWDRMTAGRKEPGKLVAMLREVCAKGGRP